MNIGWVLLIVLLLIGIVVFKIIRQYLLIERINRYENLRHALVYKLGVIKAEKFSYVRLEKIHSRLKKTKEEFKKNPHMLYNIITETEDDMDTYFN